MTSCMFTLHLEGDDRYYQWDQSVNTVPFVGSRLWVELDDLDMKWDDTNIVVDAVEFILDNDNDDVEVEVSATVKLHKPRKELADGNRM